MADDGARHGADDEAAAAARGTQPTSRQQWTKAGVAVGIGSAALVAALLFANRDRKGERRGGG